MEDHEILKQVIPALRVTTRIYDFYRSRAKAGKRKLTDQLRLELEERADDLQKRKNTKKRD